MSDQLTDFLDLCQSFRTRLVDWAPRLDAAAPVSGLRLGVVVTPWMRTAVPHFGLEVACFHRWRGRDVKVLLDPSELYFNDYADRPREVEGLVEMAGAMPAAIPVIDVRALGGEGRPGLTGPQTDLVCFEQAVQRTFSETAAHQLLARTPGLGARFDAHYRKIREAIEGLDLIFMPGGVYGVSALYLLAVQAAGVRLTTFDTGAHGMYLCESGVAAHLDSLRNAAAEFTPAAMRHYRPALRRSFDTHLEARNSGKIAYSSQHFAETKGDIRCEVLLCLNYRAETGTLFRHRLFGSIEEWVLAVMRWCVANRKHLVVRHHPVEKDMDQFFKEWQQEGTKLDDYEDLRRLADPSGKFVHLARGGDPVNTYDLVRRARVILPYVSRIGLEAAALGKPVILCAHCFYDSWGCTGNPGSRDAYFAEIAAACDAAAPAQASDEQLDRVLLCCFLLERATETPTGIFPLLESCAEWSGKLPEEVWTDSFTNELPSTLDGLMRGENYCAEKGRALLDLEMAAPSQSVA